MKKIYAKQVPAEHVDSSIYLDEETLKDEQIFIGGNRWFISLNEELYDNAVKIMEDICEDLDSADVSEDSQSIREIVESYITSELSDEKINKAVELSRSFVYDSRSMQTVCDFLSIVYNCEFTYRTLHGCSQGDWVECIYPTDLSSLVDYYEAVFSIPALSG